MLVPSVFERLRASSSVFERLRACGDGGGGSPAPRFGRSGGSADLCGRTPWQVFGFEVINFPMKAVLPRNTFRGMFDSARCYSYAESSWSPNREGRWLSRISNWLSNHFGRSAEWTHRPLVIGPGELDYRPVTIERHAGEPGVHGYRPPRRCSVVKERLGKCGLVW
jgi:hypothetical protein